MKTDIQPGAPNFPTSAQTLSVSDQERIDNAIQELQVHKEAWTRVTIRERIALLTQLTQDFIALSPRWVAACAKAKGLDPNSSLVGEEWGAGVWPLVRNLQLLKQTLVSLDKKGQPTIPGPVTTRANGQVIAQVFPSTLYDRIFFPGITVKTWMQPGVTRATLADTQAVMYQHKDANGKVALVLGAGNVASIGPMDILYKLFVEDQVVLFKANPVNAYLGPLIEESFQSLISAGYLRLTYGGAEVGAYLCQHTGIDEIHITGSDKTFDTIVFGPGSDGAKRKESRQPLLHKRVSGELGNVSPLIVVPGPWSASDLAYQAEHIVSSLTNNAGFNCNATRVIIQHADWPLRNQLTQQIRYLLAQTPPRSAYYPGARQRQQAFIAAHPDAELFGASYEEQLPWTFIDNVDANNTDDICFTTEAFCGLFAETGLHAADIPTYIEQAVDFANEKLWGTLNATLLVHPRSLQDPAIAAAVEKAIENLHYGMVGVNYWAGIGFALAVCSWGAFPGHEIYDIQSGNDVVHNTYMFSRVQKSVIRGPFRGIPTPPWFVTRGKPASRLLKNLAHFEANPSLGKIPAMLRDALGSS